VVWFRGVGKCRLDTREGLPAQLSQETAARAFAGHFQRCEAPRVRRVGKEFEAQAYVLMYLSLSYIDTL
jgi:hypothetical protein